MNQRFFVGKGRYSNIGNTRFKSLTYGKAAIESNAIDKEKTHGTYGALLFDKRWIDRRKDILARDQSKCVICSSDERLQVHHRQYQFMKTLEQFKAPWDYDDKLLITLCERCHSKGHSKFKVPTVYI